MYVANSEPAIWRQTVGRVGVSHKPLYLEIRSGVEGDGIWRGTASYSGKPYCSASEVSERCIKRDRIGQAEAILDRGWQIYG